MGRSAISSELALPDHMHQLGAGDHGVADRNSLNLSKYWPGESDDTVYFGDGAAMHEHTASVFEDLMSQQSGLAAADILCASTVQSSYSVGRCPLRRSKRRKRFGRVGFHRCRISFAFKSKVELCTMGLPGSRGRVCELPQFVFWATRAVECMTCAAELGQMKTFQENQNAELAKAQVWNEVRARHMEGVSLRKLAVSIALACTACASTPTPSSDPFLALAGKCESARDATTREAAVDYLWKNNGKNFPACSTSSAIVCKRETENASAAVKRIDKFAFHYHQLACRFRVANSCSKAGPSNRHNYAEAPRIEAPELARRGDFLSRKTCRLGSQRTSTNVGSTKTSLMNTQAVPTPLLEKAHPVDWWFVFKFNAHLFPGCGGVEGAQRTCQFGGDVETYGQSQQFVYGSGESPPLQKGSSYVGALTTAPVGAMFDQIYNAYLYYVVWNDQFYDDPVVADCTTDGNTLGCGKDDNAQLSEHFFSLKLSKDDVVQVLHYIQNASVVTDSTNRKVVNNGAHADIQALIASLGSQSHATSLVRVQLSSGVGLISKQSGLHMPPLKMVSVLLGGVSIWTATWWATPEIESTTVSIAVVCWDDSLRHPGPVAITTSGQWNGTVIGLAGDLRLDFNHEKIGISTSGNHHFAIFSDIDQQGTLSGPNRESSQNGCRSLFYVLDDRTLSASLMSLLNDTTAPVVPYITSSAPGHRIGPHARESSMRQ